MEQYELMTVREIAELLRVSRQLIYGHIHRGELRAVRLGPNRQFRVSRADLQAFLDSRRVVNYGDGTA